MKKFLFKLITGSLFLVSCNNDHLHQKSQTFPPPKKDSTSISIHDSSNASHLALNDSSKNRQLIKSSDSSKAAKEREKVKIKSDTGIITSKPIEERNDKSGPGSLKKAKQQIK